MGPKAERHYKPIEGRMRYYSNGHGYFHASADSNCHSYTYSYSYAYSNG